MKIKSDFVTNSSSTAFVLIRKSELTEKGIGKLLGIPEGSPLWSVASALFSHLNANNYPIEDRVKNYHESKSVDEFMNKEFYKELADRVADARKNGLAVELGEFRSESDDIEAFFCTDSFELENDEFYLNAVRCAW